MNTTPSLFPIPPAPLRPPPLRPTPISVVATALFRVLLDTKYRQAFSRLHCKDNLYPQYHFICCRIFVETFNFIQYANNTTCH